MARVLAVGLRDVEALHVGRVAADLLREQPVVVVEIPFVERQPHLAVDPFERCAPFRQERNLTHRSRLDPGLEAGQRLRVGILGHAVVELAEEDEDAVLRQRRIGSEGVAP